MITDPVSLMFQLSAAEPATRMTVLENVQGRVEAYDGVGDAGRVGLRAGGGGPALAAVNRALRLGRLG